MRELIAQQQKLLQLYSEQAAVERLQAAVNYELAELEQALNDALLLIDAGRIPYLTAGPTERRLINLAVFEGAIRL